MTVGKNMNRGVGVAGGLWVRVAVGTGSETVSVAGAWVGKAGEADRDADGVQDAANATRMPAKRTALRGRGSGTEELILPPIEPAWPCLTSC